MPEWRPSVPDWRTLLSFLREAAPDRSPTQAVCILIVYFSYSALGLIDVSRGLWVKESLNLSPADLAAIGV